MFDFGKPNPPIDLPPKPAETQVLTIRVSVDDSAPEIWRRFQINGDTTLPELHEVLQRVMGWENSHLHRFFAPGTSGWGAPYFVTDADMAEGEQGTYEGGVRVDRLLSEPGDTLIYTYDFGDDWSHTLVLEERSSVEKLAAPLLIDGERSAIPEDVGGIYMWNELVAALKKGRKHLPEQYVNWLPEDIAPEQMEDIEKINQLLDGSRVMDILDYLPGFERIAKTRVAAPELDEFIHVHGDQIMKPDFARLAAMPEPQPGEDELADWLRPVQTLLDYAADGGVPLTQAGWITPAVVVQFNEELDIVDFYFKGNRENQSPVLRRVREMSQNAGLLRKHKGKLVLSPAGRKATGNPDSILEHFAGVAFEIGDDFDRMAAVVVLIKVALGEMENWRNDSVAVMETVGWRQHDGTSLESWSVGLPQILYLGKEYNVDIVGRKDRSKKPSEVARALAWKALFRPREVPADAKPEPVKPDLRVVPDYTAEKAVLADAAQILNKAQGDVALAVRNAREAGMPWKEVGALLGLSAKEARETYPG